MVIGTKEQKKKKEKRDEFLQTLLVLGAERTIKGTFTFSQFPAIFGDCYYVTNKQNYIKQKKLWLCLIVVRPHESRFVKCSCGY